MYWQEWQRYDTRPSVSTLSVFIAYTYVTKTTSMYFIFFRVHMKFDVISLPFNWRKSCYHHSSVHFFISSWIHEEIWQNFFHLAQFSHCTTKDGVVVMTTLCRVPTFDTFFVERKIHCWFWIFCNVEKVSLVKIFDNFTINRKWRLIYVVNSLR